MMRLHLLALISLSKLARPALAAALPSLPSALTTALTTPNTALHIPAITALRRGSDITARHRRADTPTVPLLDSNTLQPRRPTGPIVANPHFRATRPSVIYTPNFAIHFDHVYTLSVTSSKPIARIAAWSHNGGRFPAYHRVHEWDGTVNSNQHDMMIAIDGGIMLEGDSIGLFIIYYAAGTGAVEGDAVVEAVGGFERL